MGEERPEIDGDRELATLGGGCFWCLQPLFEELRGVLRVVAGYAGGGRPHPTYEQVCSGATGHAEVVQVTFDPGELSYRELLEVFFASHDPTTPNRQGADAGTQYRSVVLWRDEGQRRTAEELIRDLDAQGLWEAPIVTELAPLTAFYPAEDYHQDYFRRNPGQGYCRVVIAPKVAKFRKRFAGLLRGDGPSKAPRKRRYTCSDYREEMRLLGLRRRLEQAGLPEEERRRLTEEIEALERTLAMG